MLPIRQFETALFLLSVAIVVMPELCLAERMSGLYVDNGYDQTVIHRVVNQREKREVENEILHLLGLPDRPPRNKDGKPPQVKRSAPKFLLDIYENALKEETDEDEEQRGKRSSIKIRRQLHGAGEFDLTGQDLRAIDQSDVIMTFTARSKLSDRCLGYTPPN